MEGEIESILVIAVSQAECCKLGQRGAKRAKGLTVVELRPPVGSSGHFFYAAGIMLRLHVARHVFYEVK